MSKRLLTTLLLITGAVAAASAFRAGTRTKLVSETTQSQLVRQEATHPGAGASKGGQNAEERPVESESLPVNIETRPGNGRAEDHVYKQPIPGNGMIEGYVHNAEGQPVAGASVFLMRASSSRWVLPGGGILPGTSTDGQGKFLFRSLPPGAYMVSAEHEEQGYPPSGAALYGRSTTAPQVSVLADQVTSDVTINLGSKVAKLVGRVVDATTHKAIKNPGVTVRYSDSINGYFSTGGRADGTFQILAPSVPFTIEVSADGYKSWHYKKADSGAREPGLDKHGDALHITSAETEELTIALSPDK